MPAYVIYINGQPGVGKLTVARVLQKLVPKLQILHNHELIDPVELKHPRGGAGYQSQRAAYRQERLDPIKTDPRLWNTVFIFTDSQMEHNECVGDYTHPALGENGRRFYSLVILLCEMQENLRRLTLPGRGCGLNGKLTDAQVLKRYRSNGGV